jgi:hypothetical protein
LGPWLARDTGVLGSTYDKRVRFVASTQEVFNHHVQGFVARDVSMVLEDYTEPSVVIANGAICTGLAYDFATDTFTIKDGTITLPTIGFVKRAK